MFRSFFDELLSAAGLNEDFRNRRNRDLDLRWVSTMNELGYLYVAAGDARYRQEAVISAASLRSVDPNAHITLITDKEFNGSLFDRITVRPVAFTGWKAGLAYKTKHIYEDSPYERTLFLDTDTYLYENCRALFGLLDYFDVCMAAAPIATRKPLIDGKPLTACIRYNTGVIAFRKNRRNELLFRTWHETYEKKLWEKALRTGENDQKSFIQALLNSDSRVYVLPNVWNARIEFDIGLIGSVKIVHARNEDHEELRTKLNETTRIRCWDPRQKRCIYRRATLFKRIRRKVRAILAG